MSTFVNIGLIVVTLYVARVEYRSSHAPILTVKSTRYSSSVTSGNYYKVEIENKGNGACLDAFFLAKEIKRQKKVSGTKVKNKYYLSKPTREIQPGCEREIFIPLDVMDLNNKKVRYKVVYVDYLGRKYLASKVMKDILYSDEGNDNKHMERLSEKAKMFHFYNIFKRLSYWWWRRQAIRQRNTYLGIKEREQEQEKPSKANSFFELYEENENR